MPEVDGKHYPYTPAGKAAAKAAAKRKGLAKLELLYETTVEKKKKPEKKKPEKKKPKRIYFKNVDEEGKTVFFPDVKKRRKENRKRRGGARGGAVPKSKQKGYGHGGVVHKSKSKQGVTKWERKWL
tara:strand:- start:4107 stop:4484 length:378 start_codon:yes stop_codon:yes gene_type:complete